MGNLHIHINYTLADIQKYLAGKLSANEMHDMEKAALQDPFLADAIEGYSQAPLAIAAQHLNQIAASLQQPAKEKSIAAPLSRTAWQWWKIAAMVIIIAGAGSLTWKIMQRSGASDIQPQELAKHEPVVTPPPAGPQQQVAAVIAPKADSIKPLLHSTPKPVPTLALTENKPSLKGAFAKEERGRVAFLPDKQHTEIITRTDSIHTQMEQAAAAQATAVAAMELKEKRNIQSYEALAKSVPGVMVTASAARTSNTNVLHGTVTDEQGQPVTGATVKVMNGNAVSITDDKGKFALKTLDSTARVEIASIGFETMSTTVSARKSNVVKLESEEESLSDMVVTELHSRKKAAPVAMDKNAADTLYPSGGWQSFQEYVYRRIHQEMDTTGGPQQVSGTIELEFAIDQDGKPRDFRVLKSFDNSLNEKAISALQSGPLWIGDKKKKGRVIVRF